MAKQKKRVNNFTVDSIRFCENCLRDIKIGLGGEANWSAHVRSEGHRLAVSRSRGLPRRNGILTNFFAAGPSTRNTARVHHTDAPGALSSRGPQVDSEDLASPGSIAHREVIDVDNLLPVPSDLGLIPSLRAAAATLPSSVPLATYGDTLSRFSGEPRSELDPDDEPWEYVDKTLNVAIGYGVTSAQLADILRRGPLGLDALCNWLEKCVQDLDINAVLLEGKIQRLLDAIGHCSQHARSASPAPILHQDTALAAEEGVNIADAPEYRKSSPNATDTAEDAAEAASSSLIDLTIDTDLDRCTSIDIPAPDVSRKVLHAPQVYSPCAGYAIDFPQGTSATLSYPFALHHARPLSWSVLVKDNSVVLHANDCSATVDMRNCPSQCCGNCAALHNHTIIMGIRHRALDGAHESTPWIYLSSAQTAHLLERKNGQINALRLRGLNAGRKLATRARHLDGQKRLIMAISSNHIPRIHVLLANAQKQRKGVFSLLELVDEAARQVYRPMSYDEADYQRAFLLWKLGGRSAAIIANHTLGVPSIDAARVHIRTKPLRPSAGLPTLEDALYNLSITFEPKGPPIIYESVTGLTILTDEIKVQERLRWDCPTNTILGICREHGQDCILKFHSIREADNLLESLQAGVCHLASEATVIASSILSGSPSEYGARPYIMSGTCKQEAFAAHTQLLEMAVRAIRVSTAVPRSLRVYCLCSDGESRRRRAFMDMALQKPLSPSSPIFGALASLRLLNLLCGEDDVTCDFDWKHVLKRFRNTLLREKGVIISGVPVTTSIIRAHLISEGMTPDEATSLLEPNDKQDVTLMFRLLNSIASLPPATSARSPTFQSSRRILQLLGTLYRLLLEAYLDINLSLHEQLSRLSAAAHMILALYHHERGDFIPAQLYFDVMSMVKNVYFCVAKTQIDNPAGEFWVILLGTDGLEKIFGKVRTMVGNDTHADLLQLANRIDGAFECVKILEQHPEWGGDARRLHLTSISEQGSNVSQKSDHITPRSWKGDVRVRTVLLATCWRDGRRLAVTALDNAGVSSPLNTMDDGAGFDILCPFGESKIVLTDGTIMSGELEEELDGPSVVIASDTLAHSDTSNNEPDLDDLASVEATSASAVDPVSTKQSAYIFLDTSDTKPVHKASILRVYSNPLAASNSKDRLRRVRGYSQYQSPPEEPELNIASSSDDNAMLAVEDPVLTLVRCNNLVFLAVIQVSGILIDGIHTDGIPATHIHEPNIRLRGRIMTLVEVDTLHQPSEPDWEWNGRFEERQDLVDIEGSLIELMNPAIQQQQSSVALTFAFRTPDLRSLGALIFERAQNSMHRVHAMLSTETFPYRTIQDDACFVCEDDCGIRGLQTSKNTCLGCPNILVAVLSIPELLKHTGAHVLHDPRFKGKEDPCGLCLRTGSSCVIYLKTKGKSGDQIDYSRSRCPNLRNFSIKAAMCFTDRSPCTNVPQRCPLCPKNSGAVWRYNMRAHLSTIHPTAKLQLYEKHFAIDERETVLMRGVYRAKPRASKKKKKNTGKSLTISEAHSTRLALRLIDDAPVENQGMQQSSRGSIPPAAETTDDDSGSEHDDSDGSDRSEGAPQEENVDSDSDGESQGDPVSTSSSPDREHASSVAATQTQSHDVQSDAQAEQLSDGQQGDIALNANPLTVIIQGAGQAEPTLAALAAVVDISDSRAGSGRRTRTASRRKQDEDSLRECTQCGLECAGGGILHCGAPGCTQMSHLHCMGIVEMPSAPWFCDNDCRKAAGYRTVGGRKKRPRVGV
ncbi:hypothetical protein FA95DRAFT_1682348 [Auriscalpium vulgare]|uniref:Uncharacterized protein n=1 Tax=Auriscalpium vulgare TaxID=40419 RepID=A0ACB8RGB2_9AGAM|nr:hypothetical protein FA95DRAFT_1682348 [Auriscalpium vulgare]